MKKLLKGGLCLCMLAVFCLGGCSTKTGENGGTGAAQASAQGEAQGDTVEKETLAVNDYKLVDDSRVYENDDETSVVTMYLTVRQGNAAESTNHTWAEINTFSKYYYEDNNLTQFAVEGILQIGDENGPVAGELGYGLDVPNSIVKIRGQTSTRSEQKNYKIELKDGKGTWREQRTINLNKHSGDGLRFRNKLAYDLMKNVPEMVSARTQFVHLYVKDETEGADSAFVDYGLFTQVEQLNRKYLSNHNLDKNGQLYKINSFEFYRYEDVIKLATDPTYDLKAFEQRVEVKGDTDHSKLISMLEELNDFSIPIEDTVEKWFDEDNVLYWIGFHIMMGNVDTGSRNYFLYSPLNVNKFYFISWDNDASLKRTENTLREWKEGGGWERGLSNYWGTVLFQRMFKNEEYRDKLTAVIEDLKNNYLTEEIVMEKVNAYRNVVKPFIYQMPDAMRAPLTQAEFDYVADSIPAEIQNNYELYVQSLEWPMPFFIGVPHVTEEGKLEFVWDPAYDFDSENITYDFCLASDYMCQNIIYEDKQVKFPEIELDPLPPGQYFIKITATNESGQTQTAFDYYVTDEGKEYGIKCFYVLDDGRIAEDIYDEGA